MNNQEHNIFQRLVKRREDSPDLVRCIEEAVDKLQKNKTSSNNPGILLGKIQSGKTRAFIGIMALAFDKGYDVSIILTKGTKALLKQTVQRMEKDFDDFIKEDLVDVFDVMFMPNNLTAYERNKKMIIVVKKEVNNMKRILEKLAHIYPDLREKKILIIDDEADFASISFRKREEAIEVGKISSQIDELRKIVNEVDYLQVTATPYSLYLQPTLDENSMEFLPKKPSFTVLVPIHENYIGGQFYFEESEDEKSIAYNIYEEVLPEERDVLKKQDDRRLRIKDVLVSDKITSLRSAIINFLVGSITRRIQQNLNNVPQQKYALVAHSEISRSSHEWQAEIIQEMVKQLADEAKNNSQIVNNLIKIAYLDITESLKKINGVVIPSLDDVLKNTLTALIEEYIVTIVVNSDKDVEELLDNDGQLKLRNPMNIFVGGQILDRGVTINNLIGFYYGRSPKKFQQDTVLQHSRMYGSRSKEDLAVTRFYTTRDIYEVMKRIHQFDSTLRKTIEQESQEKGVYFIRKDITGRLVPCSPNKLLLSSLATLQPHKRMLPVGFQSGYKSHIEGTINEIDSIIDNWFTDKDYNNPILIDSKDAIKLINLIENTLEINDLYNWSWNTFKSSIEYLSMNTKNIEQKGKIWIVVRKDMNMSRFKNDGRVSDDPDGGSGQSAARSIAKNVANDIPALILTKQNGDKEKSGWRDTPFWWPVLINPLNTEAVVFAEETI